MLPGQTHLQHDPFSDVLNQNAQLLQGQERPTYSGPAPAESPAPVQDAPGFGPQPSLASAPPPGFGTMPGLNLSVDAPADPADGLTDEDREALELALPAFLKEKVSEDGGDGKDGKKCAKCKADLKPDAKKCPDCGAKVKGKLGLAVLAQRTGLNLATEDHGLVWKVACKTGTLALSPGPGQMDSEVPLVLDRPLFDDMVLSVQEKAFPHVTVPETHANGSLENTGYVREVEVLGRDQLLADPRLPEKHRAAVAADPPSTDYLMCGIDFTEPDVKAKALRGSIPDTSIGVKFGYRNKRNGKTYRAAFEHLALTPVPWVDGLVPFGLSQDGVFDAEVNGGIDPGTVDLFVDQESLALGFGTFDENEHPRLHGRFAKKIGAGAHDLEKLHAQHADAIDALKPGEDHHLPSGVRVRRNADAYGKPHFGVYGSGKSADSVAFRGGREDHVASDPEAAATKALIQSASEKKASSLGGKEQLTADLYNIPGSKGGGFQSDAALGKLREFSDKHGMGNGASDPNKPLTAPPIAIKRAEDSLAKARKSVQTLKDNGASQVAIDDYQQDVDKAEHELNRLKSMGKSESSGQSLKGSKPAYDPEKDALDQFKKDQADFKSGKVKGTEAEQTPEEKGTTPSSIPAAKSHDGQALWEKYNRTPVGSSTAVTRNIPDEDEAKALAEWLNKHRSGNYVAEAGQYGGYTVKASKGRKLSADGGGTLSEQDDAETLRLSSTNLPGSETRNTIMGRTVEEILAEERAAREASEARIAELESSLTLAQGTISAQGEQLHAENVAKRVAGWQEKGVSPFLCLAAKQLMLADKPGAPTVEGGLNLSVTTTTDGTPAEQKLVSVTDVVEFLLSAAPIVSSEEASRLAALGANLGELQLSASPADDKSAEQKAREQVEAHEREAHPERYADNGKGARL
jgi:hypothetical protein